MAKLSLTPHLQKQLLTGLAAVVGLLVWTNLFLIPQRRIAAELEPQVRTKRKQLSELKRNLPQLEKLESEVAVLSAQHHLPSGSRQPEEQLPELLDAIAQAARSAGGRLIRVKPKVEEGLAKPGPSGYLELPIQVEASAGYHPLGLFLDSLERSENFIRVQEFRIHGDPQDIWNHKASFIFQAYLLPSREAVEKETE